MLLAALGSAALVGCKRNRSPTVAEVWDEEPVVGQAEALSALAPPWPAPVRGQLDDGLITFWLHEPEGAAMAVRLLVPTIDPEGPSADVVATIAEHVRFDWQRRVQKLGVVVALGSGPHRFEVVARGPQTQLSATLGALRATLSPTHPSGIEGARDRVVERIGARTNRELAAAATLARLVGIDEAIDPALATKRSRAELHEQWTAIADPRRCVLLVHAGNAADGAKADLRRLAEAWRGNGRKGEDFVDQATRRTRLAALPTAPRTRLLADPTAPVVTAPAGSGRSTVAIARTIPLATPTDRALARVAQRIAQEELEASIVIHGDHAVWLVTSALSNTAPEDDLSRLVGAMAELANTRHPRQRLFAATQLWLGARVVEASLGGEDWTQLFASAIDLSDNDGQIAGALAKDAVAQLGASGDALEAWTRKWLQPRTGEPGWTWSVSGLDAAATKRIARLAPVA
jgi:hypothetical protein